MVGEGYEDMFIGAMATGPARGFTFTKAVAREKFLLAGRVRKPMSIVRYVQA